MAAFGGEDTYVCGVCGWNIGGDPNAKCQNSVHTTPAALTSNLVSKLRDLSNRLRDSGRYTADECDLASASLIDEAIAALTDETTCSGGPDRRDDELLRLRKQMGEIVVLLLQNDHDEVMEWARGVKLHFPDGAPELVAEAPVERPYRLQAFWSPCRKYLVTVHAPPSDITLLDDDNHIWEASEPEQDANTLGSPFVDRASLKTGAPQS